MNFFEQLYEIKTGNYCNNVNSTANNTDYTIYQSYFGSPSVSMTLSQLTSFESQLAASGQSNPPGIEAMIQNFNQADTNHDGKLSSAEINAYLSSQGYFNQNTCSGSTTTSTTGTGNIIENILMNVMRNMASMQNNNFRG